MLLRALLTLPCVPLLLFAAATPAPGQIVYRNDFETGDVAGWSTPTIVNPLFQRPIRIGANPRGDVSFLGDFGDQRVTFTTTPLPPHDSLVVELDLYVIRSWDGRESTSDGPDLLTISDAERGQLVRTSFSNKEDLRQSWPDEYPGGDHPAFTGAVAISSLGYADGDAIYRLRLAWPHTGATLSLTLEADLRDRFPIIVNESWAIDNVTITAVQLPSPSATIIAGVAAGTPGDQVFVPVYLRDVVAVASSGATAIRTTLRYNASLLMPESPTPIGRVENGERVIDLELPIALGGDSTIGVLVFRAVLGSDTVTALTLEGSMGVGGDIALVERAGRFTLRGLCEAGGTRLFREEHAALLRVPAPNPMRDGALITYSIATDEHVRLDLIDASGAVVSTLVDERRVPGEHELSLGPVSAGRYLLRLRAGREVEEQVLVVTR